ncbi:hypothetical protein L227DRAFT_43580 [Lentinus tigrinus ALCF2SS1-6]|uniref:Uncharacterized protein n=2 Tax=Lentinus tigrinus TaxID=5365 RepID=A0A5C2SFD8_9APHY|nr:hypothetical protein L227DRAFT_43580 [Lentinus tigrinus ALCF2SS1-6]
MLVVPGDAYVRLLHFHPSLGCSVVRGSACVKARRAWTFRLVLGSMIPLHYSPSPHPATSHTLRRPLVSSPLAASLSESRQNPHCTITPASAHSCTAKVLVQSALHLFKAHSSVPSPYRYRTHKFRNLLLPQLTLLVFTLYIIPLPRLPSVPRRSFAPLPLPLRTPRFRTSPHRTPLT